MVTFTVETGALPSASPKISQCADVLMPPMPSPLPPPSPPPSPLPPLPSPPPLPLPPPPRIHRKDQATKEFLAANPRFEACPFGLRWEVTQLHHSKLSALIHFSPPSRLLSGTIVRMHTDHPTVLASVFHAVVRLHGDSNLTPTLPASVPATPSHAPRYNDMPLTYRLCGAPSSPFAPLPCGGAGRARRHRRLRWRGLRCKTAACDEQTRDRQPSMVYLLRRVPMCLPALSFDWL